MPQPTAVMQVEGVLRKPVTGAVLEAGRRLYHGLAGTYRLTLVSMDTRVQHVNSWLGMEGFTKHDHIVFPYTWAVDTRVPQWVNSARTLKLNYGYDVDLIVIPDPADAALLIERGYSTLLLTTAAYSLPEWRPDHKPGVKPWGDLEAEIDHQRALRAQDKRMEEGELR